MAGDVPDSGAVTSYFEKLQTRLCAQLEALESDARFGVDAWRHGDGDGDSDGDNGDGDSNSDGDNGRGKIRGRGITRVIENGAVFEKGGVNFSHVTGDALPAAASVARPQLAGRPFEASGVSVVLHPRNPFVPTCHMNVRFFMARAAASSVAGAQDETTAAGGDATCATDASNEATDQTWWFGGGYDLTPYYGFDADCMHWHQTAKHVCDQFDRGYYPRFKAACDAYFYLKHRAETRGIGGLFFDDFRDGGFNRAFEFARAVGDSFNDAYQPIVARRCEMRYGESERMFQQHRRGRYVEFNLAFDRGTLFGLESGGRAESILMSLPPLARWRYGWRPAPGTPEAQLTERYLTPRDWVAESMESMESTQSMESIESTPSSPANESNN
ncbi:MAG: oxygen-dependent coproporphyrinogen oxidase [Gammaproteobacteria bacterium]|nr:oxygen-dependent coproporphyrinogen oxidase [Gammaproteobacteria bacterium]